MGRHLLHAPGSPGLTPRPAITLARWAMLLVALAGLMAMHGLSDHSVSGIGPSLEPVSASTGITAPTLDHVLHENTPGDSAVGLPSDDDLGGHGQTLAELCLAVLAAVLLLATCRRGFQRLGYLSARFLDLTGPITTAQLATARGPPTPDLRMLSVQRC